MKSLTLELLRFYKRWISPAFPPSCRYVPTCSEYAMAAVERHGGLRGGAMAAWRVLRCHPFAKGGLDPVVKTSWVPRSFASFGFANEWDSATPPLMRDTAELRSTGQPGRLPLRVTNEEITSY